MSTWSASESSRNRRRRWRPRWWPRRPFDPAGDTGPGDTGPGDIGPGDTGPVGTEPAGSTTPPAGPASPGAGLGPGSVLLLVTAHINEARRRVGRAPLTLDAVLCRAADGHTAVMVGGSGMVHQGRGEAELGDRISAAGAPWNTCGENIGYASANPGDAGLVEAANGITDRMLAEVPPEDGHRKNLLDGKFTRVGLSVVRDTRGLCWMTQDFTN